MLSTSASITPIWEGLHTIILSTHTAAKVMGHEYWIHHYQLKPSVPEKASPTLNKEDSLPPYSCKPVEDLKYLFSHQGPKSPGSLFDILVGVGLTILLIALCCCDLPPVS